MAVACFALGDFSALASLSLSKFLSRSLQLSGILPHYVPELSLNDTQLGSAKMPATLRTPARQLQLPGQSDGAFHPHRIRRPILHCISIMFDFRTHL